MLTGYASVEAEDLLDGMVDAAFESARGSRTPCAEVCEEVFLADEICEESVGAAEPFMGVPPSFPGR